MSSHLSRHELDDIRPQLDRVVYKVLGSSDSAIRTLIENCLHSGFDRKRTIEKLTDALDDSRKASKISERLEDVMADFRAASKSRKRTHTEDTAATDRDAGRGDSKKSRDAREPTPEPVKSNHRESATAAVTFVAATPAAAAKADNGNNNNGSGAAANGASLTSNQIQQMMANAQREIEERKRALAQRKAGLQPAPAGSVGLLPSPGLLPPPLLAHSQLEPAHLATQKPRATASLEEQERAKKIADLQAQIRAKLSGISTQAMGAAGAGGALAGLMASTAAGAQEKPKPLILDEEGRTVDKTGRTISIPTLAPTLKANIRAKKKEIFNKASQPAGGDRAGGSLEEEAAQFVDDRIVAKPALRNKRLLRFHEPGKFQQQAERMRMKAQLEKLQNEISQIARKTGISSATKLALIAPKQDSHADDVPQMEWWDSVILADDLHTMDGERVAIREVAITNLIEHPTQMKPPNDSIKPVYLPVFLTQKERKKLRRQNRREAWKEEQEKIRIGLAPAPEPKLRISNLMRVLGTEAVQDPTKIEAHVREQMAKRQKAHEDANNARKLTAEQKREKKIRKVKEDTSCGVQVSVYRIRELHDIQAKKFKVETNAKQLLMTGVVTLFRDCCVVVVEGGPKQQKKYRRLMMQRIKWDEDMVKNADGNEVPNSCVLVWEGSSQRRHFGEVKFKPFPMEKMAREFFQKHQVEHYWDLAYSGAVLEASEDV